MRRRQKPTQGTNVKSERRFASWHCVRIGLTGRLLLLVILAVVPALVIQAWNEYDLRIAREDDERRVAARRHRKRRYDLGVAGTAGDRGDADFSRGARIAGGHRDGTVLVTGMDQPVLPIPRGGTGCGRRPGGHREPLATGDSTQKAVSTASTVQQAAGCGFCRGRD